MRWAILLVTAGCLNPTYQQCGADICPSALTCVAGSRCVDPQLVAECAPPAMDGDDCTWTAGAPGHCLAGVCEQAVCGDGYVDPALHEACDGSTTAQCVDFGFDLGVTACNADCQIDVTTGCATFGWRLAVDANTTAMWTDGTTLAYTTQPLGIHVESPNGNFDDATDYFFTVAGGGGKLAATTIGSNGDQIVELVGGVLVAIDPPPHVGTTLLAIDDAGTLYNANTTSLQIYDGAAWTTVPGTTATPPVALVVTSGASPRIFVASATAIYEVIAGALTKQSDLPAAVTITKLAFGNGALWIAGTNSLYRWDGTLTAILSGVSVTSVAVVGASVYGSAGNEFVRWNGSHAAFGEVPTHGALTSDGANGLYIYGGPIYHYTGTELASLTAVPVTSANDPIIDATELADRCVVIRGSKLYREAPLSWEVHADPDDTGEMAAIAATGTDDVVIETYVGAGVDETLYRSTDATLDNFVSIAVPVSNSPIKSMWLAPDHTLFAVGFFGFGTFIAAWSLATPADPTCVPAAVHGIDSSTAVAAGSCMGTGVIWSYANGAWSELWRAPVGTLPLAAVHLTSDGWIFATGDSGTVWFDAMAWHVAPTVRGHSLSGASSDMWLAGDFTSVQHWNGSSWSEVATQPIDNMAVTVTADEVMFAGGADGHVLLLR